MQEIHDKIHDSSKIKGNHVNHITINAMSVVVPYLIVT